MTINRLKTYPARLDFKAPLKYDVLKSDRVEHTTFVTIIHHDLGNSKMRYHRVGLTKYLVILPKT